MYERVVVASRPIRRSRVTRRDFRIVSNTPIFLFFRVLLVLWTNSSPFAPIFLSQGGSADESVMIGILSTIAPPFNREQIKSQALWAATQAVLLIQEHKVWATVASVDRAAWAVSVVFYLVKS